MDIAAFMPAVSVDVAEKRPTLMGISLSSVSRVRFSSFFQHG